MQNLHDMTHLVWVEGPIKFLLRKYGHACVLGPNINRWRIILFSWSLKLCLKSIILNFWTSICPPRLITDDSKGAGNNIMICRHYWYLATIYIYMGYIYISHRDAIHIYSELESCLVDIHESCNTTEGTESRFISSANKTGLFRTCVFCWLDSMAWE